MQAILEDILYLFRRSPRGAALAQLSRDTQWQYTGRMSMEGDPAGSTGFELFSGEQRKRMEHTLSLPEKEGEAYRVFDYIYYGSRGKKKTTVFEYRHRDMELSGFIIRPVKPLRLLKDLFQPREMLFATTPEFNKRYILITDDPQAARLDLNEDFLDMVGDEPGWTYEGRGGTMIAYRAGKLLDPSDLFIQLDRYRITCRAMAFGYGKKDLSSRNRN